MIEDPELKGWSTEYLLEEVIARMGNRAEGWRSHPEVGRNFSLARTAAEEAQWRAELGRTGSAAQPTVGEAVRARLAERRKPEDKGEST